VPRTTFRFDAIVTVSAYVGRFGGGGGSALAAGHPLSAAERAATPLAARSIPPKIRL
jgi:hypothetical protein